MFYSEALEYIKHIESRGPVYGLERMRILLSVLGNPDKRLKFIHVAGTNGKGSVTAFLGSILKAAGYRVGVYNSPSVFSYNEKFSVSGENADNEDVAEFLTVIKNAVNCENDKRKAAGRDEFCPTAFEIETALAFLIFAGKACDVCILETGCGGRLDSTNAITDKELAIITNIGLDHCALLGGTVEKIAAEKAAIIKDTVVTTRQSDGIMHEIAHPYDIRNGNKIYRGADVILADVAELIEKDVKGQKFKLAGETYFIKLLGQHQLINAALAVKSAETLNGKPMGDGADTVWKISGVAIKKGLAEAEWPARFEVIDSTENRFNIAIPQNKTLVLDGAHNPQGAETLVKAVSDYFGGKRVAVVIGVLKDKDADGIVKIIATIADVFTTVTPSSLRALSAGELKKITVKYRPSRVSDSIREAVINALESEADVVVLCGSLTLFSRLNDK